MKHLTINDINQLHAEQKAALNGMNRKYQEVQAFDKSTTRDFKPLTESGVEYPKARAEARRLLTDEMKDILTLMNERKHKAQMAKPNWSREGYMASYRFAEDSEDTILSNGKVMSGLLDETIRLRVMNEAQLMSANELSRAADAAAASGDWGSLRIYAMALENRPARSGLEGAKLKDAKANVSQMISEVALPQEQADALSKLEEIELLGENGLKIYYETQGVRMASLRGSIPVVNDRTTDSQHAV